jgi:dihydroneopterin aldolase
MFDTLHVHNLQFHALHGVYDEERVEGRRFEVDVEARITAPHAATSDELAQTVDYRDIASVVVEVMQGGSVHLIETLVERMASDMFARIPRVMSVRIHLRKWATGVPGGPEWVGITIERSRR